MYFQANFKLMLINTITFAGFSRNIYKLSKANGQNEKKLAFSSVALLLSSRHIINLRKKVKFSDKSVQNILAFQRFFECLLCVGVAGGRQRGGRVHLLPGQTGREG